MTLSWNAPNADPLSDIRAWMRLMQEHSPNQDPRVALYPATLNLMARILYTQTHEEGQYAGLSEERKAIVRQEVTDWLDSGNVKYVLP